jgi:hypothetical protein
MLRGLITGLFLLLMGLLTLAFAALLITGGSLAGGFFGDLFRQYGVTIDEFGGTGAQQTLSTATSVVTGFIIFLGVLVGLYGLVETLGGLGTLLRRGWGRVCGFIAVILAVPLLTFGLFGSLSAIGNLNSLGVNTSDVGNGGIIVLAITVGIVVLYWFSLFALITGGAHFRRR